MIGVPARRKRLFGALRDAGVSVVMISQGSSEHSICFRGAGCGRRGGRARRWSARFSPERHHGQINTLEVVTGCSIPRRGGRRDGRAPGCRGEVLSALGKVGVNIRAIAQGASEAQHLCGRRWRGHAAGTPRGALELLSVEPDAVDRSRGRGNVGADAARAGSRRSWKRSMRTSTSTLRVRAIATSKRMLLGDQAIELETWRDDWQRVVESIDLERFVAHVRADHLAARGVIDCTASDDVRGASTVHGSSRAST